MAKAKRSLGLYIQNWHYQDRTLRNKMIRMFQDVMYRQIIARRVFYPPTMDATAEDLVKSHYEFLRNHWLNQLHELPRTFKNRSRRHTMRIQLLGLRAFNTNNYELIKNVRDSRNKEVDAS